MTRQELIEKIARAIAEMEGFYLTAVHAKARRIPHLTLVQINANPGNIRQWRDKRGPYPANRGYVDFVAWAAAQFPGASREEMSQRAIDEGWRILGRRFGACPDSGPAELPRRTALPAPNCPAELPRRTALPELTPLQNARKW